MARKQIKVKPVVYLTDQTSQNLKKLVNYLDDRISEMEMDEEVSDEENGEELLPLLRGLISYLKEEHLEEEDEPDFVPEEEDEEDEYAAEDPDELEFE